MKLPKNPYERLFSFQWTIEKWTEEELECLADEPQSSEEVQLSLRVSIFRDYGKGTYFLIPLKKVHVIALFDEYMNDDEDNREALEKVAEMMMMSTLVFASRMVYHFTENPQITEHLKELLNLSTFEERKESILHFCDNYLVKSMCQICEETDMYSKDFYEDQLSYGKDSGLHENYIESTHEMIDKIYYQEIYRNDGCLLEIENTFKEAIFYIKDIDLSRYENAIGKKISMNDMVDSIEGLNDLFKNLTDKEKALGQFKIKNHPLSFILEDKVVKSKYNHVWVFENLILGIINASVSEAIINIIDKNDKKRFEEELRIFQKYSITDDSTLLLVENLIALCNSAKFKIHIPTVAISEAYFGLKEKQTLALSKFLLSSVNKDTVRNHYPDLMTVDVSEQIFFID